MSSLTLTPAIQARTFDSRLQCYFWTWTLSNSGSIQTPGDCSLTKTLWGLWVQWSTWRWKRARLPAANLFDMILLWAFPIYNKPRSGCTKQSCPSLCPLVTNGWIRVDLKWILSYKSRFLVEPPDYIWSVVVLEVYVVVLHLLHLPLLLRFLLSPLDTSLYLLQQPQSLIDKSIHIIQIEVAADIWIVYFLEILLVFGNDVGIPIVRVFSVVQELSQLSPLLRTFEILAALFVSRGGHQDVIGLNDIVAVGAVETQMRVLVANKALSIEQLAHCILLPAHIGYVSHDLECHLVGSDQSLELRHFNMVEIGVLQCLYWENPRGRCIVFDDANRSFGECFYMELGS